MTQRTDGSGNVWQYSYDNANELVEVHETGIGVDLIVDFGYDVFGNRITKTVDAGTPVTTYFAYDAWNQVRSSPVGTENSDVWGEFNASGSLTTRYLHGDGVDDLLGRVNIFLGPRACPGRCLIIRIRSGT